MLVGVAIIVGLLWCFYKYWVSAYSYWKKRGIPFRPATFPYGSDPNLMKVKEYRGYTLDKMYHEFAPHPMFGIFEMRSPMLIIRDPEIVQLVLTKEFSHFRDRNLIKLSEKDVLSHHLFHLSGEKWRALRMKLTPTFTSGRLKAMFPLFIGCAENFSSLLSSRADSKVDIKELTGRFTADVICSCAFGLETDLINHPDSRLLRIGIEKIKVKPFAKLKITMVRLFPALSNILNIRFTPLEDENYIINLVKNIIEQREKNGIVRNDFVDLLIKLKNEENLGDNEQESEKPFEMTLELMTAQCFVFFLAGFETASSVQSFCLYELAVHQDIQTRLIKEINEKIEKNGGLTYKALQEMEYLDMVVSETSRKYPTLPVLIRQCTKSITFPAGQKIEQGTMVIIPTWSLHHDPQYFPDPDKFDPERFSQENRDSIVPYTYLPFGEGPRMCIGVVQIMWTVIGLSLLAGWLLYKYYISVYDQWQKRGIPYYPSKFPFGSSQEISTCSRFPGYFNDEMYKKFAAYPMFGFFVMRLPMLQVRDPELIRFVLTKEFSHFQQRMFVTISERDVLNQHLFILEGAKWRALRMRLTPTFTSRKIKDMFQLFLKCTEAFDSLIDSKIGCEVEIKDLTGELACDIICSCGFGLDFNTIKETNHNLRKIASEIISLNFFDKVKIAMLHALPELVFKIEPRYISEEIERYIIKLVEDTMKKRENNSIKRNDFLDLLIQMKHEGTLGDGMKDGEKEQKCQTFEITMGLMAAQSFIFLMAGFETTSSVQVYCLYELALNQDIQMRVKKEIDETIGKHGGLTYEAVRGMEYLDMIISETMRKYPTTPILQRFCTKSINTPYGYKIEAGDIITIPVWSLHHDPEYFPYPEKFDPERFSTKNRDLIKPYTYLPFGEGPRMCIGMRFGLLLTKVGLITLLRKCRVEACAATKIPIEFGPFPMLTIPKDPIVLRLMPQSSA